MSSKTGTTNFELFEMAKQNNIKLDDVIMMDEITKLENNKDYNLIVNLQKTGQNGSHWVCLIIRNKKYLYIDSFGAIPPMTLIKHCVQNNFKLGYSAYICQEFASQKCGLYCLQCIKHLQNSKQNTLYVMANNYVNKYEPNRKLNEKIVLKNLTK